MPIYWGLRTKHYTCCLVVIFNTVRLLEERLIYLPYWPHDWHYANTEGEGLGWEIGYVCDIR